MKNLVNVMMSLNHYPNNLETLASKCHSLAKLGKYREAIAEAIACYNMVLNLSSLEGRKVEKKLTEFNEAELGNIMAKFIKKYIQDTLAIQAETKITLDEKISPHQAIKTLETHLRSFIQKQLSLLS